MTPAQSLVVIRMGSDDRIPRSAIGYIDDLRDATDAVLADRLSMLARYVPDLVAEFRDAGRSNETT